MDIWRRPRFLEWAAFSNIGMTTSIQKVSSIPILRPEKGGFNEHVNRGQHRCRHVLARSWQPMRCKRMCASWVRTSKVRNTQSHPRATKVGEVRATQPQCCLQSGAVMHHLPTQWVSAMLLRTCCLWFFALSETFPCGWRFKQNASRKETDAGTKGN